MARTPAALALVAVLAVALVSGGASSDPRTPPPLPGLPPPFQTVAVVGSGELTAGIDAYGDVADLRAPGPAGEALIDNPHERQTAGTVPAETGIVPLVRLGDREPLPLWRADSVRQLYLMRTNVLRTVARIGDGRVSIECAAHGAELGCASDAAGAGDAASDPRVAVSWRRELLGGGGGRVHLDDRRAREIVASAIAADRIWLARSRPLDPDAPRWAHRMYARSLLAMRALTGHGVGSDGPGSPPGGAVAAGTRDGWAYVWPRDAGAVAIALAAGGHRPEARRIARFLLGLDLGAAARFDGDGDPVAGRAAQGDAAGWVAAAARAAGVTARVAPFEWRDRADYQEKSPGDYLGNAIAAAVWRETRGYGEKNARPTFATRRGLMREAGDPSSPLDSVAAWAVRPFPDPDLFPAVRRTLIALAAAQKRRFGPGATRFGLVPSADWPEADPWTAPTAWSAWSLAALAREDTRPWAGGGRRAAMATLDRRAALRLLAALRRASTPAGLLPERVDARSGVPGSTTPLAWSHAFAALALLQLWPGDRGQLSPGTRQRASR